MAGGRWDRLRKEFTDAEPEYVKVIDVKDSQIEFVTWFAGWLRDYREGLPRDLSLALAAGKRRGGKTTGLLICSIATMIDVPRSIGWAVSASFRERDELEREIDKHFPRSWFRQQRAPEFRYKWANGSVTRIVSADDPESLKMGRADCVFVNEAQKIAVVSLTNALGGTIDCGGLALVAANPPRLAKGEYVNELKEAIEDGRAAGICKFFDFDPAKNSAIDQAARGRFAKIAGIIDPLGAALDADGEFLPIGTVAYGRSFQSKIHCRPVSKLGDVTAQYIGQRLGGGGPARYLALGGVDFNAVPYQAGVMLRVFRNPDDPTKPIYHAFDEVLREGIEDDFLDDVEDAGYSPEMLMWIGDASGGWQSPFHIGERARTGRVSYDIFKSRRFRIDPPQKKRTTQGDHPKNPAREDRVGLVNKLLIQKRLFVDPEGCPKLVEALKKCELRHGKPVGRFAHLTDALGYPLWWLEPMPKSQRTVDPSSIWSVGRPR